MTDVKDVLNACGVLFDFCHNFILCEGCPLEKSCFTVLGHDLVFIVDEIMNTLDPFVSSKND